MLPVAGLYEAVSQSEKDSSAVGRRRNVLAGNPALNLRGFEFGLEKLLASRRHPFEVLGQFRGLVPPQANANSIQLPFGIESCCLCKWQLYPDEDGTEAALKFDTNLFAS